MLCKHSCDAQTNTFYWVIWCFCALFNFEILFSWNIGIVLFDPEQNKPHVFGHFNISLFLFILNKALIKIKKCVLVWMYIGMTAGSLYIVINLLLLIELSYSWTEKM